MAFLNGWFGQRQVRLLGCERNAILLCKKNRNQDRVFKNDQLSQNIFLKTNLINLKNYTFPACDQFSCMTVIPGSL